MWHGCPVGRLLVEDTAEWCFAPTLHGGKRTDGGGVYTTDSALEVALCLPSNADVCADIATA